MEDSLVKNKIGQIVDIIRKYRKQKGLSHENMAVDLKISPSTYNKIERQDIKLTLERFLEIQEILNIPYEDLFDLSVENIYNQSFNDSSIFHQEVQNLYHDNKELNSKFIDSLLDEISFLKALLKEKD